MKPWNDGTGTKMQGNARLKHLPRFYLTAVEKSGCKIKSGGGMPAA